MPKSLDYIQQKILEVSEQLGVDPQNLSRDVFCKNSDVTKNDLSHCGGYGKIKSNLFLKTKTEESFDYQSNYRLGSESNYIRKLERDVHKADYFSEKIKDFLEEYFRKNPVKVRTSSNSFFNKPSITNRMITSLLSDLHFGVDVKSSEVLNSEYNWKIASRRLACVASQVAEYKLSKRDNTELTVVLNGDIIHGVIHLSEAYIKPLAEQIHGTILLFVDMFEYLLQHFKKVNVLVTPGNHDRMTYRSPGRALSQRWDSYMHTIFVALGTAFRNQDRIKFTMPKTGIASYTTPGDKLVIASHGDTEPTIRNFSKSLNLEHISNTIYRLESSRVFDKKIEVALFGHWHLASLLQIQNGCYVIVNGCLIGNDGFSQNALGQFNTIPSQTMFESTNQFALGDFRVIQVKSADFESQYNDIIRDPTKYME